MNISYFDGVNEKLFNAIPKNAERILELGCANGLLGEAYKIVNPYSHWTGIDINPEAIEIAKNKLDVVKKIDLNQNRLIDFLDINTYDVIVIGDLLEHMINPEEIINDIHKVGVHNAQIIMCIPNMCSMQVIEKMILGDLTYDEMGLLDKTHLRFFSQPSIFKLILDCGFLPELIDSYNIQLSDSKFLQHIIQAASSLGMPNQTFINNLQRYQLIIRAFKNKKLDFGIRNFLRKWHVQWPVIQAFNDDNVSYKKSRCKLILNSSNIKLLYHLEPFFDTIVTNSSDLISQYIEKEQLNTRFILKDKFIENGPYDFICYINENQNINVDYISKLQYIVKDAEKGQYKIEDLVIELT